MSSPRAATSEAISSFDLAAAERIQRCGARRLIQVAVQRRGVEAVTNQRAVQLRDLALAIAEDDGVLEVVGGADGAAQRVALVMRLAAGLHQLLQDRGDGGGGLRHLDLHRIVQELLGDAPDLRRHGGGEEQRLARERHELADALDVRDEAHVEHAVGFVDDEQFDAGHQQPAALEMVEQPARRRDQHVDAAHQLVVLVVKRNAADDEGDVELVVLAVLVEAVLDLGRELAGRLQDQRARHARPRAALLQHGEHRQHERCRLAGAGLRDAEHVSPCEHVGDRLFLDRGGSGDSRPTVTAARTLSDKPSLEKGIKPL